MVDLTLITNAIVRNAIAALQEGNKEKWFELSKDNATLYDDGRQISFKSFFQTAIGHERFTSITRLKTGDRYFCHFHSDQWGDFKTFFKFSLSGNSKISKLESGRPNISVIISPGNADKTQPKHGQRYMTHPNAKLILMTNQG